jgi:hypothetical protein
VKAATQDELRQLLEPLNLPESVLSACRMPERSTRFISQSNALYFELPTQLGWDESEKLDQISHESLDEVDPQMITALRR